MALGTLNQILLEKSQTLTPCNVYPGCCAFFQRLGCSTKNSKQCIYLGIPTHCSLRSPYHSWSLGRIFRAVQESFSAVIVCSFLSKMNQIKSNQIKSNQSIRRLFTWNITSSKRTLQATMLTFLRVVSQQKNSLHGWIANTSYWSKVVGRPFYRPKLLLFTTCLNWFRRHFPTLKPARSCRLGFLNKIFQVTAATWRYCSWAHRRRAYERKPRVWAEKRDTKQR